MQRFLREALVICAAGALLGLLFGGLLAYAIAAFAGWQVAWAPVARQAAALDPIAAIRDE